MPENSIYWYGALAKGITISAEYYTTHTSPVDSMDKIASYTTLSVNSYWPNKITNGHNTYIVFVVPFIGDLFSSSATLKGIVQYTTKNNSIGLVMKDQPHGNHNGNLYGQFTVSALNTKSTVTAKFNATSTPLKNVVYTECSNGDTGSVYALWLE